MRTTRRFAAAFAAVSLALGAQAAHAADAPGPPPGPPGAAVDQYREFIPTGGGPVASGSTSTPARPLPPALRNQVRREGGADAGALERVATSPAYGAPQRSLRLSGAPTEGPGPVGAALSAVGSGATGEGGAGRLVGLLVALLAIAGFAALASARRRAST